MGRSFKRTRAWPDVEEVNVKVFFDKLAWALSMDDTSPEVLLSQQPNFSGDVSAFESHWLLFNVLRKYPFLSTGIDTRKVAEDEFFHCESVCEATNRTFSEQGLNGPLGSFFLKAQRKIAQVLGPVPDLHDLDFRFGPGSFFSSSGNPTLSEKLEHRVESTYQMRSLLPALRDCLPHLPWDEPIELVHGSRLSFVPKSAKTDRAICIEPLLNTMVQKGIGSYIKNRLLIFGVNLFDQSLNRTRARGAFEKREATVDLSSASDLISFGLVYRLLPIEWVEFLDKVRCHRYFYNGVWREFHKFSSMGCAFTFELESLIFWALCGSVGGFKNVSVYGDDIITPVSALETTLSLLNTAGFRENPLKTFGSGPFRESCGGDFYLGCDVTPFRIKKRIRSVCDVFWLANSLSEWTSRCRSNEVGLQRLLRLHRWVLHHVKPKDRLYGPKGYGDGHLHAPFDFCRPTAWRGDHSGRRTKYGWAVEGWWFMSYVEAGRLEQKDWTTAYALYPRDPDSIGSLGESRRSCTIKRKSRILGIDWPE